MASLEPLSHLLGFSLKEISKEESALLEADLLELICAQLLEAFRIIQKEYFQLMKFTLEMENHMLETQFIQLIIRDILQTGEYTLQGIALYTNIQEDVINELASGINSCPSLIAFRKILEIHKSVRLDVYDAIRKKLISKYSS